MRISDTRSKILIAAKDLTEDHNVFSKDQLAEKSGVGLDLINDHFKRMIPNGDLIRVSPGAFVYPGVKMRQELPVSVTVMVDGTHKIERGDNELVLSRIEARLLKMALGSA